MSTSRPLVSPSRSARWDAGSTAAMLQSLSPTDESENRPLSGGVIRARATVIARARSVPNHGLARALFTGLRGVATRRVGRVESSEASKRGPVAAKPAHPPSASADAAEARPRRAARRETATLSGEVQSDDLRSGGV